jgi:hypothetical protein
VTEQGRLQEGQGKSHGSRCKDVDSSSSDAQSSSSSEDEDVGRRKDKKSASRNLSGLSCMALEGFCGMAHSSSSKKRRRKTATPTRRMR